MDKKEYRTREQIESIFDSAYIGNWSQAYDECVEYGVYAVDLIRHLEEEHDNDIEMLQNAVHIAEGGMKKRLEVYYAK